MYAVFFHSIWKNLHRAKKYYTSTACGACDKYEVWSGSQKYLGKILLTKFEKYSKRKTDFFCHRQTDKEEEQMLILGGWIANAEPLVFPVKVKPEKIILSLVFLF